MQLQEIINLTNRDQGKVFVVNEVGDLKLVLMSPKAYLALKDSSRPTEVDAEVVNRRIMQAQLTEDKHTKPIQQKQNHTLQVPTEIPTSTSEKATEFAYDLREEVIDTGFDFDF
jgi:hypothetical protein